MSGEQPRISDRLGRLWVLAKYDCHLPVAVYAALPRPEVEIAHG